MNYSKTCYILFAFMASTLLPHGVDAQQAKAPVPPNEKPTENTTEGSPESKETESNETGKDQQARELRLAKYLSGANFVGNFTIEGQSDKLPKPEAYTISKCEKLPQPDMYRLTARIKYGDIDSEVPLDLKILWAGGTPVITMDAFWIPGMGTFGARVLIHANRYSGTWQHDEVGGHLFGVIKKD